MIDDIFQEIEEAIMALKLAGADVPSYTVLENGVVYFDYGTKETDLGVSGEKSRS